MDETPVCVLGLGLIGGSVLRAAVAAGRDAFGYNRSADGADAARADGYAADTDLIRVLSWAAERRALIVVAVPMPAVTELLGSVAELAPDCPLTDVISVKAPVRDAAGAADLLDRYVGGHPMAGTAQSGWSAGNTTLFTGAPWVVSVDDHVDARIFAQVMHLALDCGAVVVPAISDEHDRAAAAISHLPHLLAETLAATAADVPLAYALAAGSFRDGTRVAGTAPELVRAMCEANADELTVMLDRAIELLGRARAGLVTGGSVAELVEAGHAARVSYDSFSRPDILTVRIGAPDWRSELAAAGRAGGVIRSALPAPDSRR
ncbi:MAG: prephenate dehydrogenase [Mycobacterium sp.]|nr:prephenate dehydrogenase [Mycobacterium sp.]